MSTYTAVIGDTSSIGMSQASTDPAAGDRRRNPAVAAARILNLQNPHIIMDSVGGFITADFAIPPEEAQLWRPVLRYGAVCWLFDGATPIFHGWLEKPSWDTDGSALMTISGPYLLLGRSMMREAWDLWDMSIMTRGITFAPTTENRNGQVTVNSDGSMTLSVPNGTSMVADSSVSVDYFLFGEASGTDDDKLLTAFELSYTDAVGITGNRSVRVKGRAAPGSGTQDDLIYNTATAAPFSSDKQGALNLNGTNSPAAGWTSSKGYRCLRFEFHFTLAATPTQDNYVTFNRIRVGTREDLFQPLSGGIPALMDTGAIARDILTHKGDAGGSGRHDLPQEFWASRVGTGSPDSNTNPYLLGGIDPRFPPTSASNSGVGVTGFSQLEWATPADILAALAVIDRCRVGFYLPYGERGGYDLGGTALDVASSWLTAPPKLSYQAFTDPTTDPDYTIRTREGAIVEQNTDAQPLIDTAYVMYQTLQGRQLSMVVNDASYLNYLYAQGFRRAEDYTFQPSVGDINSPIAVGGQMLKTRRNPYQAATITIEQDGAERWPILHRGAQVQKLATIRPGSVHVTDMLAGTGLRAGYATHVEWWGKTLTSNEKVQLTLGAPGMPTMHKASAGPGSLGHIIHRHRRIRWRML